MKLASLITVRDCSFGCQSCTICHYKKSTNGMNLFFVNINTFCANIYTEL